MDLLTIIKFCAEECARQSSGEISVYFMADAWMWVFDNDPEVNAATILEIGRRVDPRINRNGFRTGRVWIGGEMKPVVEFDRVLSILCEQAKELGAEEFYRQFEEIHPFTDGNGRTGAILYNYMLGKILDPIACPDVGNPNFFKSVSDRLS